MARYLLALTSLFLVAIGCGSSERMRSLNPPLGSSHPGLPRTDASRLLFPPPIEPGRARPDPSWGAAFHPKRLRVLSPELDDDRSFQVYGRTVRWEFSAPVLGAKEGSTDVALEIKPPIEGQARWVDERTLEFTATKAFDPEQQYRVTLPPLRAVEGPARLANWSAAFNARGPEVAGKELGYLPVKGKFRPVALSSGDGQKVSVFGEVSVLFDQAISLNQARALLRLHDADGEILPINVRRPARDDFGGIKVDRGQIVTVRSARRLKFGTRVTLVAESANGDGPTRQADLVVADALAFKDVRCGYAADPCRTEGDVYVSDRGEFRILFNQPLRTSSKMLRYRVQVTPPVRNLQVRDHSWDDGELVLRGGFAAARNYQIRVSGLKDIYGNAQKQPVTLKFRTLPNPASIAMGEGLLWLDPDRSRHFEIASRNVAEAELVFTPLPATESSLFRDALEHVQSRRAFVPAHAQRYTFSVRPKLDELVVTELDLTGVLKPGIDYVVSVEPRKLAFGAPPPRGRISVPALVRIGQSDSLAVHVHQVQRRGLVHVAKLDSGEPVAGARVGVLGSKTQATTSAEGIAVLDLPQTAPRQRGATKAPVLEVRYAQQQLRVPVKGRPSDRWFPEYAHETPLHSNLRGYLWTDRGIYRPGESVGVKASLFRRSGQKLAPEAQYQFELSVWDPSDAKVFTRNLKTSDLGSADAKVKLSKSAKLGAYRIEIRDRAQAPVQTLEFRVAEFKAPKFAVDVDVESKAQGRLSGAVRGRYLFGAPLSAAKVRWSLQRTPAELPRGSLAQDGLVFHEQPFWYEDETKTPWSRTGTGALNERGELSLSEVFPLETESGPQRLTLEAEVIDETAQSVAARSSLVVHPASRYAGLRVSRGWLAVGEPLEVSLGVVDRRGAPVEGARVTARLERIRFHYDERGTAGGGRHTTWSVKAQDVGSCQVTSKRTPVVCKLAPREAGDYRVVASVDGRPGGTASVWVWGGGAQSARRPSHDQRLQVMLDRASYRVGDRAKVLVENPFPEATIVLTSEAGGLLQHWAKRVSARAAQFEVPIQSLQVPHFHLAAMAFPIGAKGQDRFGYRVGAQRVSVSSAEKQGLQVKIEPSKAQYLPGTEASLLVEVSRGGRALPGAEVGLALVDEGALRMTNYRVPDPFEVLHPGTPLAFSAFDTRDGLAALLNSSHVAGGGGEAGNGPLPITRKDFRYTALWKPRLLTNSSGIAKVAFRLPDSLTEFRAMAVAFDKQARSGTATRKVLVTQDLLVEPVLPRFLTHGDRFSVGAQVHNRSTVPFAGMLELDQERIPVRLAAGERRTFSVTRRAQQLGERSFLFELTANGKRVDRVRRTISVRPQGTLESPVLYGSFGRRQQIDLALPEQIVIEPNARLTVQIGPELRPDLGRRLEFLLDYPHGCVEQTTAGLLPLLSAKRLLPYLGITGYDEAFYRQRVLSGLRHLDTMRTDSGGLGYWPGAHEPNLYGTAYAMRAVVAAKADGFELPRGLLPGMTKYLSAQLKTDAAPEVRAAIALSLAEIDQLPQGSADALFELAPKLGVFGKAALSLALSHLSSQEDRVATLLDQVEAAFDDTGTFIGTRVADDHGYFGSTTRDKALAVLALGRLRPESKRLPAMVSALARESDTHYTTQATAYALMALAEQVDVQAQQEAQFEAYLDGQRVWQSSGGEAPVQSFSLPLAKLKGKKHSLVLTSDGARAVGFSVRASYVRKTKPNATGSSAAATSPGAKRSSPAASSSAQVGKHGPEVYRVLSTPEGQPIDPNAIVAGDLVRVALLVRLPRSLPPAERNYLAIVDRVPAGFEPVDPNLASVATAPSLTSVHPLYRELQGYHSASFVELGEQEVRVYFDHPWDDTLAVSYVARATTPGVFHAAPATAAFMYKPQSLSRSEGYSITIVPTDGS